MEHIETVLRKYKISKLDFVDIILEEDIYRVIDNIYKHLGSDSLRIINKDYLLGKPFVCYYCNVRDIPLFCYSEGMIWLCRDNIDRYHDDFDHPDFVALIKSIITDIYDLQITTYCNPFQKEEIEDL